MQCHSLALSTATRSLTTPVAAAVGLLIGLFINRQSEKKNDFIVPVVAVETTGQSILDDGADYSMFISM